MHLIYRATGRTCYVSATNIAFRRDRWTGYDTRLTQGGDELDLLRRMRREGRVIYDHGNPTYTSGRRFNRGLWSRWGGVRAVPARATCCQVGRCVRRYPETTDRIAAAGHVIGNHSLTHRFTTYLRPGAFRREVDETQQVLRDRLGRTPALARTPWLWRRPALLRMLRRERLEPVAGVFCHPLEVFHRNGAAIARHAIAQTRPGTILIFHDGFDGRVGDRTRTVQAVKLTVDGLLERGYRFVTVDELLGVPAYHDDRLPA